MKKSKVTNAASVTSDFVRGAVAAASVAGGYDASCTHDYRLEDCVLFKLNLRKAKPRRNAKKVRSPAEAWIAGFSVALAEAVRSGCAATTVRRIAAASGITLRTAKKAGVDAYDLKDLKRAEVDP